EKLVNPFHAFVHDLRSGRGIALPGNRKTEIQARDTVAGVPGKGRFQRLSRFRIVAVQILSSAEVTQDSRPEIASINVCGICFFSSLKISKCRLMVARDQRLSPLRDLPCSA